MNNVNGTGYGIDELKEHLSVLINIHCTIKERYICLLQINNHKKTDYGDVYFNSFMIYSCWYIMIIQLSKVFCNSKNQKYNIYSLLESLRQRYDCRSDEQRVIFESLDRLFLKLTSAEITNISSNIKILRDKFYAHTDKDRNHFINEINVSLDEVDMLLGFLQDVIFDLYSNYFNSHFIFDDDIFIDFEKILTSIDDYEKRRRDEIIHNAKILMGIKD